jgi:hypothetical protein
VIIHDFNLVGAIVMPYKTDSPLAIDADAVLTSAVALQGFELISGRDPQAGQFSRRV